MTLDIKKLSRLEQLAMQTVKNKTTDEIALDYINNIPLAHSQPYLRAEYMHYYFACKQEHKDKQDKT